MERIRTEIGAYSTMTLTIIQIPHRPVPLVLQPSRSNSGCITLSLSFPTELVV